MAAPLGIIGGAFQEVWNDRDRILLMQRTRDRLKKWGYNPEDIPLLFEMADADGTGEVDYEEFCGLIKNMKIGLSDERIAMLFNSFDDNNSGTISSKEFIQHIFPTDYIALFRCDPSSSYSAAEKRANRAAVKSQASDASIVAVQRAPELED